METDTRRFTFSSEVSGCMVGDSWSEKGCKWYRRGPCSKLAYQNKFKLYTKVAEGRHNRRA